MATGTSIVEVIKRYRYVYDQENQHLSQAERDKGWKRHWNVICAEVTGSHGVGNNLPQKRSSSTASIGMDPHSKRSGHPSMATLDPSPASHNLQRQVSAPATTSCRNPIPHNHPSLVRPVATTQHPRRASVATMSYPRSCNGLGLTKVDEGQMYAAKDYLARSPEDCPISAISLTTSPTVERGEYHPTSHLINSQVFSSTGGLLTPPTSETSWTSASTATSEPMTRSNTNEMLSPGMEMMRVHSQSPPERLEPGPASGADVQQQDALFSFAHDTQDCGSEYHEIAFPVLNSFPYCADMKHSLSHDSNTSCHSVASNHSHILSSTNMSNRAQELRRLEPKQSHDVAITQPSSPEVKLVERTLEDGTKVMKAEISRAARHQFPRKQTFCTLCNDQPQGFHGEHELQRHRERQHSNIRRVWICNDISGNGFLDGCKACRNKKTYGANYNAAAHLRRAHFNPCKNKRGGRGKKSEGRGGMGGGNKPSMDELKHWMYPMYEIIIDGKVVNMIPVPPAGQEDVYANLVTPIAVETAYPMDIPSGEELDFEYAAPITDSFTADVAVTMSMPQHLYPTVTQTMPVTQQFGYVEYIPMQQSVYTR